MFRHLRHPYTNKLSKTHALLICVSKSIPRPDDSRRSPRAQKQGTMEPLFLQSICGPTQRQFPETRGENGHPNPPNPARPSLSISTAASCPCSRRKNSGALVQQKKSRVGVWCNWYVCWRGYSRWFFCDRKSLRNYQDERWRARYCQTFLVVTVPFFLLRRWAEEWTSLPKTSGCHCKGKQSPTAKCSTYTHWMCLNHVILGGTPPTYGHFGDFQRLLDKWRWLKMFHSCPVYVFIRFMPKSMLCAIKIN